MMGWESNPLVPEKKIFEGFLPYGRGGHLGHDANKLSFPSK